MYEATIFFDNGDLLSLDSSEVIDVAFVTYDRLVKTDAYCPVAAGGYARFRLAEDSPRSGRHVVYNSKKFRKGREAIEERLVNEGGICCVEVVDDNNWAQKVAGCFVCKKDGDTLVVEAQPLPSLGESSSDQYYVQANPVGKTSVRSIEMSFENCDWLTVYDDEITDLQLAFFDTLTNDGYGLRRRVKSGHICIKLSDFHERNLSIMAYFGKRVTLKKIIKRICPKKGIVEHDFTRLDISFDIGTKESFWIEDIRYIDQPQTEDDYPEEDIDATDDTDDEDYDDDFIGGYATKLSDGTIVITFGKNAEDRIKKLAAQR